MKTSHFLMLIALCMLALTGCSNDDIQSVDTTPAGRYPRLVHYSCRV